MNRRERAIFDEAAGGDDPRFSLRTNTRIDTGSWWRRAAVWICLTDQDLVLLAAGRRPFLQQLPIAVCQGVRYCHATGELAIETEAALPLRSLAMSPTEGLQVLDAISQSPKFSNQQGKTIPHA